MVDSSNPNLTHRPNGMYELRYDFDELARVTAEMESIANRVKERHREGVDGFNVNLTELISRIRGGSFRREIIPIVGRRGLGKSTLARNACNHPLIVEYFDICAWVRANGCWLGILRDLLRSMNSSNASDVVEREDELCKRVQKNLKFKIYLIVLDDILNEEDFDKLRFVLPENCNGSRIVLTTRHPSLVTSFSSNYSHNLEVHAMNFDQSWNLLRQKVFKQDHCPPILEFFGKMIARSCRGNPLAIEVVSGVLIAGEQTVTAWENIAENMKTAFSFGDDEHLSHTLSLSYTHLPHHLRPCFLYTGALRDDHEIRVSKLVKLWVAEDLLKGHSGTERSFEEIAEDYVEELVSRNLALVSKRKSNGGIKFIRMHDLIRDMCLFISKQKSLEDARASTSHGIVGEGTESLMAIHSLRRVLDVSNAYHFFNEHDNLPLEIFDLVNLKYLALDHEFSVGEAISGLKNLQTLIIGSGNSNLDQIVELPVAIWRMPNLRHINVYSHVLPPIPEKANVLENLQSLSRLLDFTCSEEILERMPNLKKLSIFYTERGDVERDYQLHNLALFKKLKSLKLATDNFRRKERRISLAFPPGLEKLSLSGLGLPWEDLNIVDALPYLRVLKLRGHACVGDKWETSEGGFPQLKFLMIHETELKHWVTHPSHFPRLESLFLYDCRRMREIPRDFGGITTLRLIEVDHRNKLLVDSAKGIQEDHPSLGEDALRVHVVKKVRLSPFFFQLQICFLLLIYGMLCFVCLGLKLWYHSTCILIFLYFS